jgi:hypothetical protein
MNLILVGAATWNKLVSDIAAIRADIAAIKAAIGALPPDIQAKLNTIFDAATADSAKIDAALLPQPPKDSSHG